ncbi:transposable element Tcb1 transposase [Trichonephila clavipes]|nr:transposable element Tcb1 transposase [Trichonephila clavipes]
MKGKRARRHFSQLSEFERGLIIGMKTAGWSTRRVAGQVDCSECAVRNCWEQWTGEGTHARKTGSGATRKTTRREDRRIVRQALVDPTVTRSTIRADVGLAIVPQKFPDTLQKQILNPSALSVHSLSHRNIGNCVYSGAKPDQCGMSHIGKRLCLVMNPGLFWGEMITVHGCGGTLNLPWPARSPDLSAVEHVWDQLKRQMPSCHSVHDLELAVQDLWAHLPQDNIRCLIN